VVENLGIYAADGLRFRLRRPSAIGPQLCDFSHLYLASRYLVRDDSTIGGLSRRFWLVRVRIYRILDIDFQELSFQHLGEYRPVRKKRVSATG
jgi:hypothetical protein